VPFWSLYFKEDIEKCRQYEGEPQTLTAEENELERNSMKL